MFCLSCGKKITESSKFCKYCGVSQLEIEVKENRKVIKKDYKVVWVCDYCGEESQTKSDSYSHEQKCIQNPKNKKFLLNISPKRAWKYLWLMTMLVFFINIFITIKYEEVNIDLLNGKFLIILFLSNIGLGIISFLAMIISNNRPKNNKLPIFIKYSLIICFLYLLINSSVFAFEGYKAKNNEEYKNKYYIEITPVPTVTPSPKIEITPTSKPKTQVKTNTSNTGSQIECIGPDGKHFNTTMDECKKLADKWGKPVDYMTNCNIHSDCGGGTVRMSYSQCMKPCSGLTNKTNNTQVVNNPPSTGSKKTAVYITSWNTTYYCPAELVDGLKTADVQNKIAIGVKSDCDNKAYSQMSSCDSKCIDDYYPDQGKMDSCIASCDLYYKNSKDSCAASYKYVNDGFMNAIKGCSSFQL